MAINNLNRFPDLLARVTEQWQAQRPDLPVAEAGLIGCILGVAANLEDLGGVALKEAGLSQREHDVLACLRRQGEPFQGTPSLLLEEVRITSGALTLCCDRLIQRGLLTRTHAQDDKRSRVLALTAQGKALIDEITTTRFQLAEQIMAGLSPNEQKQLQELLLKVQSQVR
ncbi:MarR family transcriptional regulator [Pseudidiomarina aquimaris]|uniref:MarR family transcriptional regulator n=1 Tax=Pseudidiomarina aquimaris TaxID=641841 RepID=A0A432XHE1_9GAMM|nr:MarR family transcriptional regulator [Pseudidiomarina aquimaris]RUO48141.1 MarR family transcriptional regulator [Pseudidiomarina aquimaris]